MNISRVVLTLYRIPFVQPYTTAAGTALFREGIIVRLSTDAGVEGLGESSLLPHLGNPEALFDEVVEAARGLPGQSLRSVIDEARTGPHWAGIETAAWDASARADALPLSRWMWANAATAVDVNALVSASTREDAVLAATTAEGRGFTTIKLKVGVAASAAEEVERVQAVRQTLSEGCRLRLDANGAWDEAAARDILRALHGIAIEYLEQPLPPGNIDGMVRLQDIASFPLAVDEEITDLQSARPVIEQQAAQVMVLKPIALGGLQATYSLRGQAMRAGMETTITTSIDTGIGTALALHIAAGTESRYAAGLATAHLLESDLLQRSLPIANGRMAVPEEPGLGVTLDETALQRYTAREVVLA